MNSPHLSENQLEQLVKGIEEFNRQEFYESHETWERMWIKYKHEDRTFFQGLIQIAAGLYLMQTKKRRGSFIQFSRGLQKLKAYPPEYCGFHLENLLILIEQYRDELEKGEPHPIPVIQQDAVPFLKWSPPERHDP